MGDHRHQSGVTGWAVTPPAYLDQHPAAGAPGAPPFSQYVTVRDGTRLAVDVHLPQGDAPHPTVLVLTPYYRRFALRHGHAADADPCPTIAYYRDLLVPRGYALVAVDVRGTGASFGHRSGFRAPVERDDHYDIADWVAAQDWCDGAIGATGISYPGAAADFLASTAHPAVKAVAPLFAVWDTWSNHLYPGGVLLACVAERYGALADALDHDRRDQLPAEAYFNDDQLAGPAPVDDDADGSLLRQAIAEHRNNFTMPEFTRQIAFRDSPVDGDPDYTSASISPYRYANREADAGCAIYSISGWMDGGGYSTGAIQRFLWLDSPHKRLMLGPWDHGARSHVSPWRSPDHGDQQAFVGAEVVRFFDRHLRGGDTGLDDEKPVHYFTMGAEQWRAADSWPPAAAAYTLYPAAAGRLADTAPHDDAAGDDYRPAAAIGTGRHTRYDRLYLGAVETYYDDWHGRDAHMLNYTGGALDADIEVTGHPTAELHFTCSASDCVLIAYVSDITPDGRSVYVTEGVFRALHRKPGANPPAIPATGPTHSFAQADAEPLVPGAPATIAFELLPTSYLFRKGHRIRLSIALGDSDHLAAIPADGAPAITLHRDPARPSRIVLPVVAQG